MLVVSGDLEENIELVRKWCRRICQFWDEENERRDRSKQTESNLITGTRIASPFLWVRCWRKCWFRNEKRFQRVEKSMDPWFWSQQNCRLSERGYGFTGAKTRFYWDARGDLNENVDFWNKELQVVTTVLIVSEVAQEPRLKLTISRKNIYVLNHCNYCLSYVS